MKKTQLIGLFIVLSLFIISLVGLLVANKDSQTSIENDQIYTIKKAPKNIQLNGTPWSNANVGQIQNFPWYKCGRKQETDFRLMYDKKAIYIQFICEDKHIDAKARKLNGPVCRDSCVEFFAQPNPDSNNKYFNFEANCCAQIHLGFGNERKNRQLITSKEAEKIKVISSFNSQTKKVTPDDNGWWLAAKIPFDVLSKFMGFKVSPKSGHIWKANLYRCGGSINPQYAAWKPILTKKPDFHRPTFFETIKFE